MPRNPDRRSGVIVGSLAFLLVSCGHPDTARGEESANDKVTEIYFNPATGAFDRRLTVGKELKVAILAAPQSQVSFQYYVKTTETCPALPPAETIRRAGVPVGTAEAGKLQKYTLEIGPLFPAREYCFHTEIQERRALSKDEENALIKAVADALVFLVEAFLVEGNSNNRRTTPQDVLTRLQRVVAQACSGSPGIDRARARILPCAISAAATHLAPDRLRQSVAPSGRRDAQLLSDYLLDVTSRKDIQAELTSVVLAIQNGYTKRKEIPRLLEEMKAFVTALGKRTGALYDPIRGQSPRKICEIIKAGARSQPALVAAREEICPNIENRAAFIARLYKFRQHLMDWTQMPVHVRSFLKRPSESPYLTLQLMSLKTTFAKISADGPLEQRIAEASALKTALAPFARPRNVVEDWMPDGDIRLKLYLLQLRAAAILDDLQTVKKGRDAEAAIRGLEAFPSAIRSLRRILVETRRTSFQPRLTKLEERIPFQASIDVGAVLLVFEAGAYDFAQSIGVNLYFAHLDPDEPLSLFEWPGSTWYELRRRLSLTAGFTTVTAKAQEERGVDGALTGQQILLFGAGFRFTEVLRLSGGMTVYGQQSQNPVRTNRTLRVGGYLSLSIDVRLFQWISSQISQIK